MTEVDKDFDLLAGHDLADSRTITAHEEEDPEKMDVLVWHKLVTVGYQPSAREGHTAVTNGFSVLVFGGFEAGQRVNALISLDVTSCSWSVVQTKGTAPCPRSYHAANRYRNLMIIHGGEAKQEVAHHRPHVHVSFDATEQIAEFSRSIGDDSSNPTLQPIQSQSTSVLNVPALQETRPTLGHDGVTLGDTLCGTKLAGQIKVARGGKTGAGLSTNTTATNSAVALHSLPASAAHATSGQNSAAGTGVAGGVTTATAPSQTCCLDDLHVLDTISMEWHQLRCILSPLPRKGHTLSMLPIQGVEHAVIFGGYSIENVTLSNSLHVCEAEVIYAHYTARRDLTYKQRQSNAQSTHMGVIKALKSDNIEPVMWRTLSTSGAPPSPRYRHSSTLIHTADGDPLLVIVGGIGTDASVALSDVFILDLNLLHWTVPLTGNDALAQGIGGDGPIAGLYGHVAFSVTAMGDPSAKQSELLVFGGSSNPNSNQHNCNQSIFAYNMVTHTWRRVPTGYAFPSGRASHSAALVQGWAPVHDAPGTTAATAGRMASTVPTPSAASNSVCAVIFGGLDSIQCASDTWALDLKWRKSGVEQYDACVSQQEAQALQQPHITTSAVERSYLQAPGLLNSEHNASLRNLVDPAVTTSSLGIAGRPSPQASPLQQFRRVPLDRSYDMSVENGQPAVDRTKKQAINSRRYTDIAANTPTMTMRDSTRPGKTKSTKSSNITDFRRSSSQSEADFAQIVTAEVDDEPASGPQSPSDDRSGANYNASSDFQNYAVQSRDYRLPGTVSEQQEIGSAFLKVRKERAQTELALQRERERTIKAEATIVEQAAEILRLQQQLEDQIKRYNEDVTALQLAVQQGAEREKHLKEISDEACQLLTMYGVHKI